ncbi:AraC family transcriptional regulator [Winogradskya consettensis]|uniref:AraC family transcriptional regulator n=1 Tax=Winogradskya consettensis TaxID=113560 RepID=A0A919T1P1_9ACTN|nr:AraC family transcriptional regulator [Actinoplanes consettensis]GIM82479.1 AraC family transcriptional regulator [Actinoplanes consettensis]
MSAEEAAIRAICLMREKLGENLTLDDLARAAMFSKFHFSRVFQKVSGISPGHFLSAVRIKEAQRLLATTPRTVADIGATVGYTSLGTFTSKFSRSVGLSPGAFRHQYSRPRAPRPRYTPPVCGATISGELNALSNIDQGPTFVGLFPEPIAEGFPTSWTIVNRPGPYQLYGIGRGTWHVVAHCLGPEFGGSRPGPARGARCEVGARSGPVSFQPRQYVRTVDITLHTLREFDPPALLSMPAAMS